MAKAATSTKTSLIQVPLVGLRVGETIAFPLYLVPGEQREPVLFADAGTLLDESRFERLHSSGVDTFLVPREAASMYYAQLEKNLDGILSDDALPAEQKGRTLHTVAVFAAESLLKRTPDSNTVRRVSKVVESSVKGVIDDPKLAHLVRQLIRPGTDLSSHLVNTSLYGLGLGLALYGNDLEQVYTLSLAGLLHDIGRVPPEGTGEGLPGGTRIGEETEPPDYEHTLVGAQRLLELNQGDALVLSAAQHHERFDGSGAPEGLTGNDIHPVARAVALLNLFDHVRSSHRGYLGVFDTFKIIVESYRDCFDPKVMQAFLQTFASTRQR